MIKLGIIGFSEGNGHPYSWGAIFNGYDPDEMKNCDFPIIYDYLRKYIFPKDFITNAEVTHIWTQSKKLSKKISKASKIKYIVETPEEMIGFVDGVLLARDDAENHMIYSINFLRAGIPIYIDKPMALSIKEADSLFRLEKFSGQIFSCSALRFSEEMMLSANELVELGGINHIRGTVPKSWAKYVIHAIDPIIENIGFQGNIVKSKLIKFDDRVLLNFVWESGITCSLQSMGASYSQIEIEFFGKDAYKKKKFHNAFPAFKRSLEAFLDGIVNNNYSSNRERIMASIMILEKGI